MASTKFTIVIGDSTETFTVRPRDILKSERESKNLQDSPIESTYRLAWYAAGAPATFDEWIDTVDELTPILPEDEEGEEEAVPPTTAGSRRSRSTQA
jgi:hypothetical protein